MTSLNWTLDYNNFESCKQEHKPDNPIEKFRITSNGATVSKEGLNPSHQILQILSQIGDRIRKTRKLSSKIIILDT